MRIIIIGVGKVGTTLIESFVKEGHDIVVVDLSETKVANAVNKYDVNGIIGGGLERSVLSDAGVESADFFIACTSRDETNVLCCVLAKKLGAKRTIARVRDPQYFKEMENLREYLGLDLAFNPEYRAAMDIINVLDFPSAKSVESFAGGKALLVEFYISAANSIKDKPLMEVAAQYKCKFLFCMVKREDKVFIPRGDFVIHENDSVYIIATESELKAFCKKLKIFKSPVRSVFIIGGSKIAYYLTSELVKNGVAVKIIENDKTRCKELSERIPEATILFGDGTDQNILREEGLKTSDACVTLTGVDEENVIISLYAKMLGVGKVVTKVDRPTVTDMVKKFGLDTVVSPRNSIANHIIRFVRKELSEKSEGMNALYKLHDKVEAVEFTVGGDFSGINKKLSELKIKKDTLIGGIVRDGEFILPVGETRFLLGDRVIVVAAERKISALNDMLI